MIDFGLLAFYGFWLLGVMALAGWALYINRERGNRDDHAVRPGESFAASGQSLTLGTGDNGYG